MVALDFAGDQAYLYGMRTRKLLVGVSLALLSALPATAAAPGCGRETKLQVCCSRNSALIDLSIVSCRKIGDVVIEVKDNEGHTLYREEGKAMTPELIRRLDKGTFPKGELTMLVTARDFRVSQRFTVE